MNRDSELARLRHKCPYLQQGDDPKSFNLELTRKFEATTTRHLESMRLRRKYPYLQHGEEPEGFNLALARELEAENATGLCERGLTGPRVGDDQD